MVTSNAPKLNVLPLVTDWLPLRLLAASRRLLLSSTSAQWVADPVALTLPSVMALTVTLRPLVSPSVGALTVGLALVPSLAVPAPAKVVGSLEQM